MTLLYGKLPFWNRLKTMTVSICYVVIYTKDNWKGQSTAWIFSPPCRIFFLPIKGQNLFKVNLILICYDTEKSLGLQMFSFSFSKDKVPNTPFLNVDKSVKTDVQKFRLDIETIFGSFSTFKLNQNVVWVKCLK